jgi:hypothetical protein
MAALAVADDQDTHNCMPPHASHAEFAAYTIYYITDAAKRKRGYPQAFSVDK